MNQWVVCITDEDKITYRVAGPFDLPDEAKKWADAMEYDSYDTQEMHAPEELDEEE